MRGPVCVVQSGREVLLAALLVDGVRSSTKNCVARMVTVGLNDEVALDVAVIAPLEKFEAAKSNPGNFDWLLDSNRLHLYRETRGSRRVERLMGNSVDRHLEFENTSVANVVCEEAFGITLAQLQSDLDDQQNEEDAHEDSWARPKTLNIRQLKSDERVHLYTRRSKEWRKVINNSNDFEVADDGGRVTHRIRVRTRVHQPHGCWCWCPACCCPSCCCAPCCCLPCLPSCGPSLCCCLPDSVTCDTSCCTPACCLGVTLVAAVVTGAALGGWWYYNSQGFGSAWSGFNLWGDYDNDTNISSRAFRELRVPQDICSMLPNSTVLPSATRALADSWNQVEWCNGNSGRLVCGSTHANPEAFTANLDVSRGLSCYNFLAPFKYDLPSVWEAIVRHDAPERCAVVCDTAETTLQRRGRFLAKKFGIRIVGVDPKKVDDEVLEQFSYNRDCSHAHSVKDIKPEPECSCDFGVLECYVHTGTGREIAWGKLLDLDTNEEQLSKYVSGLHREGYEGTRCIFECYKK